MPYRHLISDLCLFQKMGGKDVLKDVGGRAQFEETHVADAEMEEEGLLAGSGEGGEEFEMELALGGEDGGPEGGDGVVEGAAFG